MVDPAPLQERLEAFHLTIQNLKLQPLTTPGDLNRFRVEYGSQSLDELEQAVADSLDADKILFTGHTGCGKSTLLAELRDRLALDYFVVMFSISDLVELSDVNHVNILFSIATQLMEAAEDRDLPLTASAKKSFYQWFGKHTKTETSQIESALETGYEAGGGFNPADIIAKFWVSVKGALKINSIIRDEIRIEFERRISDLIDRINEIAQFIQNAINQPILLIIDDLDKLSPELTDKIYRNNIRSLFQPEFRIIYTLPIFVQRDITLKKILQSYADKIHVMQVAQFFPKALIRQPDADPDPDLMETFRQILYRRLGSDLIESDALEAMILSSGGVLREFLRIARGCCDKCSQQLRRAIRQSKPLNPDLKIDSSVLQEALTDLQIEFAVSLGRADYEMLRLIYEKLQPERVDDQRFLDLLHGLYILEYPNGVPWYDLHPIVLNLLKEQGLIGGTS